MNPGQRLKAVRVELGLSQVELATLVGAGRPATVSDWERGKTSPDKGVLRLIADLTADAPQVYQWLQQGGQKPRVVRRQERGLGGQGANAQHRVSESEAPREIAREIAREWVDAGQEYRAYARRVAEMAATQRMVPAYELLEGATMLLKLYEDYRANTFRLRALLSAAPLLVFELDGQGRVVEFHGDQELFLPADLLKGKRLDETGLIDVAVEALQVAIRQASKGEVSEEQVYKVPFQDKDRHYSAVAAPLGHGHVIVFVRRQPPVPRLNELGLGKEKRRAAK